MWNLISWRNIFRDQRIMNKIEHALAQLRAGKMIVVIDDESRENEGDLIAAASLITAETIHFMARQGCGLICLALTGQQLDRLELPLMIEAKNNKEQQGTAFTVSIDAAQGISTGISAADRAKTILAACDPAAVPSDLNRPGHIFPLRAVDKGVLERRGHTEAAVDLMRLAGLVPAGVICEIMASDGSMMRYPQLKAFAEEWQLPLISINDLVLYRQQERHMTLNKSAQCQLPTRYGVFDMAIYSDAENGEEAIVLTRGEDFSKALVRIHSECLTGDVFASLRCDCGPQLEQSLAQLAQSESGILIYLRQEGRGIGLMNKIRSYALQEKGLDTVEANHALGFPNDTRSYDMAVAILKQLGVRAIQLLTNNPQKIAALKAHWPEHSVERAPLEIAANRYNRVYLETKQQKMNHWLSDNVLIL